MYYVDEELANTVEIRHTFVDKPKIGILGDSDIHATIFDDAGLLEGIHYHALGTDAELIINQTSCFTLVSNSHDSLKIAPERASLVQEFTKAGGNFFAQDSAAVAYGANGAGQGVRFLFNTADAGESNGDCMSEYTIGPNKICSAIKKGGNEHKDRKNWTT